MQKSLVPKLAFDTLKKAESDYQQNKLFSSETLESLHSFFGETVVEATELLEKCRVFRYLIPDRSRQVYKIITSADQYTIYDSINFCQCTRFQEQVLKTRSSLTCVHVLAVNLAKITNSVREEFVTSSQLEEFLNQQLNYFHDDQL